ncbi:hypothetical protein LPJ38_30085 [Bradyrhizobium daqingense]|uniref:hypothetical protein n=1 Tax=Bradyrhizobium TaxID=374 RepID=UPI0011A1312E|nr:MULTISPECIES: hypothetical protein [Bradyrhizobium]MDQ8731320.1 hypothetical protein [Bradyrhizobium sp. LHD-71]UFS87843.1 hypothetical protein LPJ38_30085 [Bradyrhizobium daqingense]
MDGGYRTVTAYLLDDAAAEIASALSSEFGEAFRVSERRGQTPTSAEPEAFDPFDAILLIGGDAETVSAALLGYVDRRAPALVAPVTERYYSKLPLYLISIPKAGTHLLFRLAEALGYAAGGVAPDRPKGGHWYYLLHSNAHTMTREFFRDELQRAPFGNRAHPFMRSPALFNYRNPFDILVSEANYWHIDGNSPLSVLLGHLSFEERIARLMEDRWLLGSVRDRVGEFAAWLDCGNVVPISFEEIVGDAGGGSDEAFEALVWSLQLKLHAPGITRDICAAASGRSSPTFREGRINGWRQALSADVVRQLEALPQDFMVKFGYDGSSVLPRHVAAFRHRPLRLMSTTHFSVPFLVETDFLDHNIVSFNQRYYGIPFSAGSADLRQLSAEELARFANSESLASVRAQIVAREVERQVAPMVGELVKSELEKLRRRGPDDTGGERAFSNGGISADATEGRTAPVVSPSGGDDRVGEIRPLGSFLRHNLFERRDGVIAVPMRIGPVDPNLYDLRYAPGVIAERSLMSVYASVLRASFRWVCRRARL